MDIQTRRLFSPIISPRRNNRHPCAILSIQRRIPMLRSISIIVFLTLSLTAAAQNPVARVGKNCPPFTSKSGDYCVPRQRADGSTDSYIVKSGNNCPYGYSASGDYCRKAPGDRPESIPREGKNCPYGWQKAGDYCRKSD